MRHLTDRDFARIAKICTFAATFADPQPYTYAMQVGVRARALVARIMGCR